MARTELLRVFSKTLCLLVLANADFSRALIDDCVDFDLAQLDRYVSSSSDTWGTQGNRSAPAEDDTGSLERFGTLESDWTRLISLRDALPEDSILKRKFNHLHRLLLVAHEQATASRTREFPASPTGSTTIVEDHEDAEEAPATTESRNTSSHRKDNTTVVSSYRDAGGPSSATFETSSSTRSLDYPSRVTEANDSILGAHTSNETTTLTSSQENATPVSPGLTSSGLLISSSTSDATGSWPDGQSREKPYGDSAATRSQSSTTMRMDDIVFASPKQNDAISMTPSSLAGYSSTLTFLTDSYTKGQPPTSSNAPDAKTQQVIETKERSYLTHRVKFGDVSPETTSLRSATIVRPTPTDNPMPIGESSVSLTTARTSENTELPIPLEGVNVVSEAKEALSNETQLWSTLEADDRANEYSSLPYPTTPTKAELEVTKTNGKNETNIQPDDVLGNTSSLDNTGQPLERAELTELRKIGTQKAVGHTRATSHEADGPTSTWTALELPSSTGKTMEKEPIRSRLPQRENSSRRSYELVEYQSTSLIDPGYIRSATTPLYIRNVPSFQKNALHKSSSRIKDISRDYRHETAKQLGSVQRDSYQGIVYELGVSAENRTFWRQRLEQQSPLKNSVGGLAGAIRESGQATISSPGAHRKEEVSSSPENLRARLDESSTRSSLLGRTSKLRPRRRGSSGDSGKRFKTFHAQEQFEDRGGSRGKEEEAAKIKIQCKSS